MRTVGRDEGYGAEYDAMTDIERKVHHLYRPPYFCSLENNLK